MELTGQSMVHNQGGKRLIMNMLFENQDREATVPVSGRSPFRSRGFYAFECDAYDLSHIVESMK